MSASDDLIATGYEEARRDAPHEHLWTTVIDSWDPTDVFLRCRMCDAEKRPTFEQLRDKPIAWQNPISGGSRVQS